MDNVSEDKIKMRSRQLLLVDRLQGVPLQHPRAVFFSSNCPPTLPLPRIYPSIFKEENPKIGIKFLFSCSCAKLVR
jgi:hypothetical protein